MFTQKSLYSFFILFCVSIGCSAQQNCACWVSRDTSFHVVPFVHDSDNLGGPDSIPSPPLYRNDDGVTNAIKLPFSFCYWGKTIDSVYINNNGNISFDQQYSSYSPSGFPLLDYEMVAPFWGDVDTRLNTSSSTQSGVVYYKITPDYMIVQWDSVGYYGYYSEQDSLLNSFQVIITNGNSPIIPKGNNVEFCYGNMQWTSGWDTASTNGIGGAPATVGANKGDSTNYIQFGLFDNNGNNYAGQYPTAPYDGISWLNGRSFFFNTCASALPPIVTGISACDTIVVCMGDTVDLEFSYLAPNSKDSVRSALLPAIPPGASIIYNHPGNTDSLIVQIIASSSNVGYHTINICGFDNNVPSDTTFNSIVLEVDPVPTGTLTITKDTICKGDSTTLTITSTTTPYKWNTGQTTSSITVKPSATSNYSVQVGNGKCNLNLAKTIVVLPAFSATITPGQIICDGKTVTLTATGGGTYLWNNGATTDSITVTPSITSTYSVTVTNKCTATAKTVVTVDSLKVTACCDTTITYGSSVTMSAKGVVAYQWNPQETVSCPACASTVATPTATTTYTVTGTDAGGCTSNATIIIMVGCEDYQVPNVFTPNGDLKNDDLLINAYGVETYQIEIFNRWGVKVFTSTNMADPWNGKINNTGADVPDGVYYYLIKSTCGTKNTEKHGFVQVIR
ncbi:MAG TPA: nidogen-like domain-containing protein [Bacteroidia bacterium]|nr:nidogen-like domain-containing protein [Bacteroidia bacterium]